MLARMSARFRLLSGALASLVAACGGSSGSSTSGAGGSGGSGTGVGGGGVDPPTTPACATAPDGGSADTALPVLLVTLADRWEEGWLASPAVVDLDGDGENEIVAPRGEALVVWSADGSVRWKLETGVGRIWASPVIADFAGDGALEIAIASRDQIFLLDADGELMPGFPVTWEDELRAIAAGDLDADGVPDIAVSTGRSGPTDVVHAFRADGSLLAGFPPNGAGTSGCDEATDAHCYLAGCYDQNLAIGDLDGDGSWDLVAPHDNAYASFHHGSGEAFDAAPGFASTKTPGVRYLHELTEAQQGWAEDEATALQAHFTNTAPAIADVDGDGTYEVVMLGSVQNASQDDREQGVGLWVVRADASRPPGWEAPFHAPDYLAGLWDYEGTNVVGATNQVSIADLDAARPGKELVFPGFDGRIHAVSAAREALWSVSYTNDPNVLTGGVVLGDLSGDGVPEVVFATYSPDEGKGALVILDAGGNLQHQLALPRRGAMPVPTLADVDGDGTVEIVVSLKDAEDQVESVLVYTVPGSADNCLPWPTGRANLYRNGWVP
jgi:hypothetical protein